MCSWPLDGTLIVVERRRWFLTSPAQSPDVTSTITSAPLIAPPLPSSLSGVPPQTSVTTSTRSRHASVTERHLQSPSVTSNHRATPPITRRHLQSSSVTSNHRASSPITMRHLQSPDVTQSSLLSVFTQVTRCHPHNPCTCT